MTEQNQKTMDDDTRYLLPSEIARLVYGYLKQNHCDEVAEKFLNISPHLKECLEMRNKNRTFMTKAHNLTLEEISNQCLKMNEMLLEAVNKRENTPKKFHDPVEALRFIIDPSTLKDCSLVTDEPMAVEDDTSTDVCFDLSSTPERAESSDISKLPNLNVWSELTSQEGSDSTKLPNLNFWSESTSKELGIRDERKKEFSANFEDGVRPTRNLDRNAVLNKSGKVKVLRPRNSLPVVGKTMTRRASDEQELTSSLPGNDNPLSTDLELPSPESPSRKDDNLVSESLALSKTALLEIPVEEASVNVTAQLSTPPAKTSENAVIPSSRSRRNRKKSSGSWNGEQMSLSKSSCNKIVPEIEKGHMLIQQALIKNPKIHERIAENINKAISESPQKKMVINPIDELNSTVKKVADDTLNDPLCKDIINELLSCLTNVNLGLESETDDADNVILADKFYENTHLNNPNFPSDEPVRTSVPANETNSNYQSLHNYVSINSQQQQTEIFFVGEMQGTNQNHPSNQNYHAENQENTISNSNVDIRSYFTNTPDIKESCDTVETINGTVINVLEPGCPNLIPVHGIEIARSVPLFIGSAATSATAIAPVAFNSKKRSARIQQCVFPTSRASRRLTPIAPKPNDTPDVENQPDSVVLKNNNLKRPSKKMKK